MKHHIEKLIGSYNAAIEIEKNTIAYLNEKIRETSDDGDWEDLRKDKLARNAKISCLMQAKHDIESLLDHCDN